MVREEKSERVEVKGNKTNYILSLINLGNYNDNYIVHLSIIVSPVVKDKIYKISLRSVQNSS